MKRSPWRYLWQTEDIRNKLIITFLLLVLYRLAANIPVPGINQAVLTQLANAKGAAGNLVNLLDLLSGGTISSFSILAMGVYPYITAQIILQLLGPIIPALERRMKENPTEYQKWQEKWTVILTVPMALLSAIGQVNIFRIPGFTTSIVSVGWFWRTGCFADHHSIGDHGRGYDVWDLAGPVNLGIRYSQTGSVVDHLCRYCGPDAKSCWIDPGGPI